MRKSYLETVKQTTETFTLFLARLKNLLLNYVKSLKVNTFDELFDLIILDRLKDSLSFKLKNHIVHKSCDGKRLSSHDAACMLDTFVTESELLNLSIENKNVKQFYNRDNRSFNARAINVQETSTKGDRTFSYRQGHVPLNSN